MKLLKNAGTYEIVTPISELKKQLLRIEEAGRTCYQSFANEITARSATKFVKMLIARGHFSVLEHTSLTVRFKNVSRGFTHELVRHRLCAFSQESTRYVDYAKRGGEVDLDRFSVSVVAPPHRDENEKVELKDGRKISFKEMARETEEFYRALRKAGWLPEDARQILPNGLKAEIVVTANLREWMHILYMRTAKVAHWEIRAVMVELLRDLKQILPPVFELFAIAGKDQSGVSYAECKIPL